MTKLACAYIGLGSNLEQPAEQIKQALNHLADTVSIHQLECSPWYQSDAVGPGEQPDYVNAVARLRTSLTPPDLLTALQTIENLQGRQRDIRWGARTLDLDLLLYDNAIIDSGRLTVPHPQITQRNFVLLPLYDLAPNLQLPRGERLSDLVAACDNKGLQRLSNES